MTLFECTYESPLGSMLLGASKNALTSLSFGDSIESHLSNQNSPVLIQAQRELDEWFAGTRRLFTLPLEPAGTVFQQAVWAELIRIQFGETKTYSEIARILGKPKAARAVGSAVGKNPLILIIPCHRVVGIHGPGGFSAGMPLKHLLCSFEGIDLDTLF